LILPEIVLVAVDLGIPGEWPFFWQRFSLRSLLSVAADMSKAHGIPCLAGVSAPTLSVLDACGVPTDSALGSEVENPVHASATFVLRSQNAASEKQTGPSGVLLAPTMRLLRQTYDRGKDSMLLFNIRGFATLIECAECGYTATCPDCGATLTLGSDRKRLFCKQCGHSEPPPDLCPNCHGTQLRSRGYGLDHLARELQRTFPVSAVQLMTPTDEAMVAQNTGPSLFLGTYADVQRIAVLKPELVVFPDVSVGLRHPVFDNIEQLAVVVRGAVAETVPGTVLIQLDRRSTGLRGALDGTESMATFLENEREQRRELLMPPFARQFVVRVSFRGTSPDADAITRDLGNALTAEGVDFRGLHADLLTVSAQARVLSLEFRADCLQAALGLRVGIALAHNRHFQNAAIRVY
jgi:primosomal protein N'